MSLKSLRSLASLCAVALGAALLAPIHVPAPAAGGAAGRPLPPAIQEKLAGEPWLRDDQPGEALEFYRMKRAPIGEVAIPSERYLRALDAMRTMPQHSTARQTVLPSRADLAARGLSVVTDAASLGSWTPLGPGNIGGRTRVLVIDPKQPRTVYAAAASGGVWKSTDAGKSWTPLADLLANLSVNALAIHPADSNVLYAGTGEGFFNVDAVRGAGIFKTRDAGLTWTQLAGTDNPDFYYVNDIVISGRRNIVYAATDTGIFRSADGGSTWTKIFATDVIGGCLDLALRTDLKGSDVLLASCGTFEQAFVIRNVSAQAAAQADGAWRTVLAEAGMGRTALAIAPSNQNVIYALAASNEQGDFDQGLHAVFRSLDGGRTWNAQVRNTSGKKLNTLLLSNPVIAALKECGYGDQSLFFNQGWYDNVIAVDPKDPNRVWVGGVDLFRSDDGGRNWGLASYWWATADDGTALPSYAHADQHAIVFHPNYNGTTNRILYVGNDGGIFRLANSLAPTGKGLLSACDPTVSAFHWQTLNNGYAVTQFYNGTPYPDGTTYFGGTQDNGTVRGTDGDGPNAWQEILGGDGGFVAVDPNDPHTIYAENTGLSIAKSTDGGQHWARVFDGIDPQEDFLFITPYVMDPSDAQSLWLGGGSLWRTTDGAGTWQKASARVPGTQFHIVSAVTIDPRDSNHVLAGTVEGFILRNSAALTADGTAEWPSVQPQRGYVTSVTVDPTNSSVAYATYSTFGTVHVWKSADGGATWSALEGTGSGKLPDVPANAFAVDPAHPDHLYVATDLGVFASIDGGQHWLVENTGFANVATDGLVILPGAGGVRTLFAFSHGRGAWKVALPD
jgi:photosystem II stability/assembly factor-like uncharacterized protein